jgi:hypothetical protein
VSTSSDDAARGPLAIAGDRALDVGGGFGLHPTS